MRIALLTAMARKPGDDRRRAFRRFLGRTVLSHQVDCALELGCDAVICLVEGVGQEIFECQHRAEEARVRFQTVTDTRALSALIRADDELLVLADGLLPDPDLAVEKLSERRAVLTFPAEPAISQGFERIDASRAWAGMLSLRGEAVEKLVQLPPDAEAASSLMRIALQSGDRTVALDPAILTEGRWEMEPIAADPAVVERAWIGRHVTPVGFGAPGRAIAERIGARLARDVIGSRSERLPLILSTAAGFFAAALALFGHPVMGLVLAVPMAFGIPVASVIDRVSRIGGRMSHRWPLLRLVQGATDFLLAALVALALPDGEGPEWQRLFLAATLLLSLRIAERFAAARAAEISGDRVALTVALATAALMEALLPVVAATTLAALLATALRGITPD